MTKIKAKGIFEGMAVEIIVSKVNNTPKIVYSDIYYDDFYQELMETRFSEIMKDGATLAEAYVEPDTMLAAYLNLKKGFFDNVPELEIEGELETIYGEEGKVY